MIIRSKTLRWLIILSALLVALIVTLQLIWLQKIYRFERKQFNIDVTKSIKDLHLTTRLVNDSIFTFEKNIQQPAPANFISRIDRMPPIDSILALFSKELTDFNLLTDCRVSIYDHRSNKYAASGYINMPDSYGPVKDKLNKPVFKRNFSYLAFHFPHREKYILMQMLFWIISSATLLLVLIGFAFSVFYLYHQQFLNETQKDFVNNFTHEFKTPLSVMKISSDVLRQPSIVEKPEKLHNYAKIIGEQVSHLQNQLNRMLMIAYTEHSNLPLQKEKFDAHALLQLAINNISPLTEQKKGTIHVEQNAADSVIHADRSYLLLAYINVLENAVKYSVKPEITVSTYIDGNDFCTDFHDNGIGIEKKQQRRIFQKFYRVTDGNLHQGKGFGLGLNFVKKIVDAHRGNISVDSSLGKGSTFTIRIPRH